MLAIRRRKTTAEEPQINPGERATKVRQDAVQVREKAAEALRRATAKAETMEEEAAKLEQEQTQLDEVARLRQRAEELSSQAVNLDPLRVQVADALRVATEREQLAAKRLAEARQRREDAQQALAVALGGSEPTDVVIQLQASISAVEAVLKPIQADTENTSQERERLEGEHAQLSEQIAELQEQAEALQQEVAEILDPPVPLPPAVDAWLIALAQEGQFERESAIAIEKAIRTGQPAQMSRLGWWAVLPVAAELGLTVNVRSNTISIDPDANVGPEVAERYGRKAQLTRPAPAVEPLAYGANVLKTGSIPGMSR